MGVPKRLTPMQLKFAEILVTHQGRMTGTEAAVAAGYEQDRARITASELQNPKKYPLVVQYIGKLRAEYQKKHDINFEGHITELARLRDEAKDKNAWSAAINAEIARGKAGGLYIEQKIIRTGKLEDLSAEELDARVKEVLEEYSPILEGVEVEELKSDIQEKQKKLRTSTPDKDYSESSESSSSTTESSS